MDTHFSIRKPTSENYGCLHCHRTKPPKFLQGGSTGLDEIQRWIKIQIGSKINFLINRK